MTVKAIYEDGVLKPKSPLPLREHEEVEIEIKAIRPAEEDDDPTGWKTAEKFIGMWKGAPPDEPIGAEHDKHLYK